MDAPATRPEASLGTLQALTACVEELEARGVVRAPFSEITEARFHWSVAMRVPPGGAGDLEEVLRARGWLPETEAVQPHIQSHTIWRRGAGPEAGCTMPAARDILRDLMDYIAERHPYGVTLGYILVRQRERCKEIGARQMKADAIREELAALGWRLQDGYYVLPRPAADGDETLPDEPGPGLRRLAEVLRLRPGAALPAEILRTMKLAGQLRRLRIGIDTGEVFAEDEDFDGLTLKIECRSMLDGLAVLARLVDRAEETGR